MISISGQHFFSRGRTIWIGDAHRDDGKRFVLRADELLTAFMELEAAIREDLPVSCTHALLSDTAHAQKCTTKVS